MNRGNTSPEKQGPESERYNNESLQGELDYPVEVLYRDAYNKAISLYNAYKSRILKPIDQKSFSEFLSNDQLSKGLMQAERLLLLEGISGMPGRTEKDNAKVVRAIKRLSGETREAVYGQGGPVSQVRPSTTPPGADSIDELELAKGAEDSSKEGNAAGTGDFDFGLPNSDQEAPHAAEQSPHDDGDDDSAAVA